jgi:hypothetical protein
MIKKLVIAVAVAAVAVSFADVSYAAKKGKGKVAAAKCTMGTMASGQPNQFGWAPVMSCGADGKMYPTLMMCYMGSSLCPPSMGGA